MIFPTRSVCDIKRIHHASALVIKTAVMISNACLKATNVRSQLDFLNHCKHASVFPPSIDKIKTPAISANHLVEKPLQKLCPKSFIARVKLSERCRRKSLDFKRSLLNAFISDKHYRLREINNIITTKQQELYHICPWYTYDEINSIIGYWCSIQRQDDEVRLAKKFHKIPKTPENVEPPTESKKKSGVLNLVPEKVDISACERLLCTGRTNKLTASNKKQLLLDTEVGVNRLICALKYANKPSWASYDENTEEPPKPPHPLKSITARFDKNLMPPPILAEEKTEGKIKKLKEMVPLLETAINSIDIPLNYNVKELKAISKIKKTDGIGFFLTDKTNNIVIAEESLVRTKVFDHLNGPAFIPLTEDPSTAVKLECDIVLGRILLDPELEVPNELLQRFFPEDPTSAPVLQPLLKDHKPTFPDTKIRPVQPVTGSAIERMDILVSKILLQLTPFLQYRVTSSDAAREQLDRCNENLRGEEDYMIASLDISNMYPNVPIGRDALQVVRRYLEENKDNINLFGFKICHVMWMIDCVFSHTYISYEGQYYMQTVGVGTGLHSSGAYADIIVDDLYRTAIQASPIKPLYNCNYVDDGFLLWPGDRTSFQKFKTDISAVWPTIKFEEEVDEGSGVRFLDMTVTKSRTTGLLEYEFYQKETNSGKYLHWTAHCSTRTKTNIIRTEASRVMKCCSNKDDGWKHLETLKKNFLRSGYPLNVITSNILYGSSYSPPEQEKETKESSHVLKIPYVNEGFTRLVRKNMVNAGLKDVRIVTIPGISVKSLIKKPTPRLCDSEDCLLCPLDVPCRAKHHVYSITCNLCGPDEVSQYIGASRRPPAKRMLEHEASARRFNKRTSVGQHMIKCHGDLKPSKIERKTSLPNFLQTFTPEIVARGRDTLDTFIREGLAIRDRKPTMNNCSSNGFCFT